MARLPRIGDVVGINYHSGRGIFSCRFGIVTEIPFDNLYTLTNISGLPKQFTMTLGEEFLTPMPKDEYPELYI
jgi:hypothetical protein